MITKLDRNMSAWDQQSMVVAHTQNALRCFGSAWQWRPFEFLKNGEFLTSWAAVIISKGIRLCGNVCVVTSLDLALYLSSASAKLYWYRRRRREAPVAQLQWRLAAVSFCSPHQLDCLYRPYSPVRHFPLDVSDWGVKLIDKIRVSPWLRMRGALLPLRFVSA
jgi:hypothetical protein